MAILSLCLVSLLATAVYSHGIVNPATSDHGPWPSNAISYRFDANFLDLTGRAAIIDAMRQITTDTGGCITWTSVAANFVGPQLVFVLGTGQAPLPVCNTRDGFYRNPSQNSGQVVSVFSGRTTGNYIGACLDSKRDTMRILVKALGMRDEWKHPKRTSALIFPANYNNLVGSTLRPYDFFNPSQLYTAAQAVDLGPTEFDVKSVTMIAPNRFSEDLNVPVFSLAAGLQPVGNLARLSQSDCLTLTVGLYSQCPSTITCGDPYADGVPAFFPTDTIKRNLQCQTIVPLGQPFIISELLITNMPYVAAPAAGTRPTRAAPPISSIPGLTATLTAQSNPATSPRVDCTLIGAVSAGPCQYGVRFALISMPATGVLNQQVTVNILSETNVIIQTITAIITLNCAPVFRSLIANVGPLPELTSEKVFRYPDDIKAVPAVKSQASAYLNGATKGQLAQFIVNYNIPNGVGDSGAAGAGDQSTQPNKVYVHCVAAAGPKTAGATVVGSVVANDAEGDAISYYAYSGDYRTLPSPQVNPEVAMTSGAEMHTVSKDGVISIAAVADPLDLVAAGADSNPSVAGNPNGGLPAGLQVMSATRARDVFIVAVDSRGASSILQARFYLGCGTTVVP